MKSTTQRKSTKVTLHSQSRLALVDGGSSPMVSVWRRTTSTIVAAVPVLAIAAATVFVTSTAAIADAYRYVSTYSSRGTCQLMGANYLYSLSVDGYRCIGNQRRPGSSYVSYSLYIHTPHTWYPPVALFCHFRKGKAQNAYSTRITGSSCSCWS